MSEEINKRQTVEDEEQAAIIDTQQNNQEQGTRGYLNKQPIHQRESEDFFDRERKPSFFKQSKNYIQKLFIGNQTVIEKSCIFITIVALITVLVGISIIIISTFNAQNLKRKEQFSQQYILKPKNDQNNSYKLLTLSNKLQIMLISNPQAQYSSLSLDVKAGSWQEPQQILGLAHFLEHVLFLQSEKYPEKGYLDQLLAKNGGFSNAYTEDDNTNFFLKTTSNALEEVIDVFANMFISPIFDEDAVKKESSAVDDEYQIDLGKEDFKLESLLKQLSDPIHPFSRFSVGNTQTLLENKQIQIVDELNDFKQKYYTPQLMKLVVYSNLELEQLEQYVQVFSNISDEYNNEEKTNFASFGKPLKELGQLIKLKNIQGENDKFHIFYQIDLDRKQYKKRPLEYIQYFLENEEEGGLLYYLKNQLSYILDFKSEIFLDQQSFVLFSLTFQLQKDVDFNYIYKKITNALVTYLEFIKTKGLQENIYHERAKIADLDFSYRNQETFSEKDIAQFSKNLNFFNYKEVFAQSNLWQDQMDKNYITQVITQMQNIQANAVLVLSSPQFVENEKNKETLFSNNDYDNNVPLFGLEYSQRKISEETLQEMSSVDEDLLSKLQIPTLNPFVPFQTKLLDVCSQNEMTFNDENISKNQLEDFITNFPKEQDEFIPNFSKFSFKNFDFEPEGDSECTFNEYLEQNMAYPTLIKYQKGIEGWYQFNQYYQTPKAAAHFSILMPQKEKNVKNIASGAIYVQMFKDQIQKQLSQAVEAGYTINIDFKQASMKMYVEGWSENFPQVIQKIFKIWDELTVDEISFKTALQSQLAEGQKYKEYTPLEQGFYIFLAKSLKKNFFEPEEVYSSLEKVKLENVQQIKDKERQSFKLVGLIVGNIQAKQAQDIFNQIESETVFSDRNQTYLPQQQIVNINKLDSFFIRVKNLGIEPNQNRGLVNYYQVGYRTNRSYALLNILIGDLNTFLYQYLRTEKQLGYQVQAQILSIGPVDGIIVSILGDRVTAPEMNNYVNEALIKYREQMPDQLEEFLESSKKAAEIKLSSKRDSLKEGMEQLVGKLEGLNGNFDSDQLAIDEIEYIEDEDIVTFFDRIFFDEKRLISVQVHTQQDNVEKKIAETDNITNENIYVINDFKTMKNYMVDKSFYTINGDFY